ncbi:endolytic transglycosylase MltG [Streptococcus suis]|nr:endolytic transglycosylase MltG [Streptococcus suis]
MTKDTNERNTQSSSFRDQILRDLEELKTKRLTEQPTETHIDKRDEVIGELKTILEEESNITKLDALSLSSTHVENLEQPISDTEEQLVSSESLSETVSQDTVERNLEELRNIVVANGIELDDVSTNKALVSDERTSLEDTVLEFPIEDVSDVTGDTDVILLEETIIVPRQLVATDKDQKSEEKLPSRRINSLRTNKQRRKKQDKTAKRIVSIVMFVLLLTLLITGGVGYTWVKSGLEPIDTKETKAIQVEIPEGSSTLDIGKILVDKKLIKNATIFNYYSKIKSYNNFQSGFYNLKQNMSVDDIAKALQESGTPTPQKEVAGKILVVEGYTLTQIATAITNNTKTEDKNDKTPFTSDQFMATVTNQDFINRMVATYPKLFASLPAADSGAVYQLEGYLFPAVYEYTEDTTIEALIEQMIATMDARLQPYYETIASKHFTVNEVLTLASLVEKEASTDEDRRNISSVFINRINANMPLQSNIAILYAQGKLGQETTLAEDTAIDTSIESPYNIYWTPGLMPGPVDSPSLSAIEAVINAHLTDYLYFVADVTTGKVYYANNFEEHNQNVAKYVNAHLE